jgi:hypothetical protein
LFYERFFFSCFFAFFSRNAIFFFLVFFFLVFFFPVFFFPVSGVALLFVGVALLFVGVALLFVGVALLFVGVALLFVEFARELNVLHIFDEPVESLNLVKHDKIIEQNFVLS